MLLLLLLPSFFFRARSVRASVFVLTITLDGVSVARTQFTLYVLLYVHKMYSRSNTHRYAYVRASDRARERERERCEEVDHSSFNSGGVIINSLRRKRKSVFFGRR